MTAAHLAGVDILGGGKGHPYRIKLDGQDYSLAAFCALRHIPYNTVRKRMRNGQPIEKALALDMLALAAAPTVEDRPGHYRIRQVVPVPDDANLAIAQALMKKRGLIVARSRSNGNNHRDRAAKRIMDSLAENLRLRTEPFERARTFLRRKGFVPVACVDRVEVVGRHQFKTQREVMDFARSRGWPG